MTDARKARACAILRAPAHHHPEGSNPMLTVWISMAATTLLLAYELLGSAADLRRWNATMRRHEGR